MNNDGLVSEQIRQQHAADIAKSETFRTHGVSEQIAKDYLDTPEGVKYWLRVREADPSVSTAKIDERAINQLTSGRELPHMEIIDEPLTKIVPQGSKVSGYSPFFTKLSEIENAVAGGQNLSDRFGLPIASEAPRYDIYAIRPKAPTEVFVNTVAPTSELGGQVTKPGGAQQYLVPNRGLYNEPELLKQIDNQLPLHLRPAMGAAAMAASADIDAPNAKDISPNKLLTRAGIIVGAAATAYDTVDTGNKVERLYGQGNAVGAESELIHFGARNLGAWSGAGVGAIGAAAVGWETGPGVLAFMAVGSVAGVVAGDKFAAYLDNRSIYKQEDRQGNTWTIDPEKPMLGWRRDDDVAMVNNKTGVLQESERSFVASPQLANELNYKATSTSVQLILQNPPRPSDPYSLTADKNDPHSITPADWKREPSTGKWEREVVDQIVDRGLKITHIDPANAEKAAALDRTSEAVIAQNAALAPAAIAARYQAAHAQAGWAAYGPVPDAVVNARNNLDLMPASNGNTYQRGQKCEWAIPGMLYDSKGQDNIQKELNATRQLLHEGLPPAPISQAPTLQSYRDNLRETVAATYAEAGVSTTPQLLEAATLAVERDHARSGITTAYSMTLQPNPSNGYSADSPIATLQETSGGVNVVKTVTSVKEILEMMQTSPSSQLPLPSLSKPAIDKADTHDNTTTNKSAQLGHPSNSVHPFHNVFNQATAHVNKEDEKQGRNPDEKSERLVMAATALAANEGMHKIDHMVFSKEDIARGVKAGENVIIVQGGLLDPAHERADMKTEVAINTPVEQSLKQMDATHQRQTQEAQSLAQQQSQSPRGPTMT